MIEDWAALRRQEEAKGYWHELQDFVAEENAQYEVFPPADQVFRAFELTPYAEVRAVIVGQDPYHGPDQAHGLAFSVAEGVPVPPSLRNIFAELQDDLGCTPPDHGSLEAWARQGVLLLNTALTVRRGQAKSHARQGWEKFTDEALKALGSRPEPTVFALWGAAARKKKRWIGPQHYIIESSHPSPLSAYKGFFGSRPFSRANEFLEATGRGRIEWCNDHAPRPSAPRH